MFSTPVTARLLALLPLVVSAVQASTNPNRTVDAAVGSFAIILSISTDPVQKDSGANFEIPSQPPANVGHGAVQDSTLKDLECGDTSVGTRS